MQQIPAVGADSGRPKTPFSIIVACLNEEDTIIECLERLTQSVPEAEILVMHGGKDRTYELARDFAQSHPNVIAVRNENDRGKGSAIKAGIKRASFDVMCQFDADLQFEPEDMARVVAPIFEGRADVVIGSRFMKGADTSAYGFSFLRTMGNRVVNGWVSLLCGQSITDVTTGYKAWTRAAMQTINFRDDGFVYEVEIPMRACLKGLRVVQVPVKYHDRQGGISGHGTGLLEIWSLGRTGFRILITALAIRLRK
ncbi:MAG TPA: glycosyltransferase family 2 protein [Candidatus Baltobacteraceae bacterium]|nr:glycosyltransferase family 2 protein [Candidatus Baltobacteraceae bacterium]